MRGLSVLLGGLIAALGTAVVLLFKSLPDVVLSTAAGVSVGLVATLISVFFSGRQRTFGDGLDRRKSLNAEEVHVALENLNVRQRELNRELDEVESLLQRMISQLSTGDENSSSVDFEQERPEGH